MYVLGNFLTHSKYEQGRNRWGWKTDLHQHLLGKHWQGNILHRTRNTFFSYLMHIVTQRKIFRFFRANVIPICNSHIINSNQRHEKVAKTLAALSLAFFSCQSPFMILRSLMCFNLASPGLVWRAAQLYYTAIMEKIWSRLLLRCN